MKDLGDFGDVDADESEGREYGMDDQLNYDDLDDQGLAPGDPEQAPARPSRPGGEARPSTLPPAETADPLDEGELTDSDLGLDDADHQGRSAPTTRTLKTDDLLDLSRRAMNDADTIAERDWLSHVADQGERGELRANAYIGPSRFTGEQDYRIGSLDADACEAEFGKWDTARQEKERADWMATQPEPRFAAERDWMMGQLGEQDYHKAFDAWAAQQQAPADADAPDGETTPAGDVTEYDLLAQETKAARFEAEAQYLAGRITEEDYHAAFDEWAAQQAPPGEDRGDGLLPSADAVGDGYTGEASWMDEEFEGGTGRRPAPAGVTADDALVGSDLPGFGAQAAVQPADPDRPPYVGSPSNLLEQAGVWAGSGLAVPHTGFILRFTRVVIKGGKRTFTTGNFTTGQRRRQRLPDNAGQVKVDATVARFLSPSAADHHCRGVLRSVARGTHVLRPPPRAPWATP